MTKTNECIKNKKITCENHSSCATCGWNPDEAARRKKYIRKHKLRRLVLSKMRTKND